MFFFSNIFCWLFCLIIYLFILFAHTPPRLSVELFLHAFFCKQNSWDILSRMAWTDYKFYKLFRRKYSISGERTKRCLWQILTNWCKNFHTQHFEAKNSKEKHQKNNFQNLSRTSILGYRMDWARCFHTQNS